MRFLLLKSQPKTDSDIIKKFEEYKQAKEDGVSTKERMKLLTNFVATNPSGVDDFLDLIKGKKDLNKVKLELSNKK